MMERRTKIQLALMGGLVLAALVVLTGRVGARHADDPLGVSENGDVDIEPPSLTATVGVGHRVDAVITITNSGVGPLAFAIGENRPATTTDFLILDHNQLKDPFASHTYDTVDEYTFPSLSAQEMEGYRVVYLEPNWSDYDNMNLHNLATYVEGGGLAVINIAGNIGSAADIDPAGTDYFRTATHNGETILRPEHPYVTGQPYGGSALAVTDFANWGVTDHGWLTDYPPYSQLVLRNTHGPSWLQYRYGSGQVIVTTLTYGWGFGGGRGAPLANLVEYALDTSGISWLREDHTSGTIAAGASHPVTVTLDAADLTSGTYTGELWVTVSDTYTATSVLPVTLTVVEHGLSESAKDVDLTTANPGDRLTYAIALHNTEVTQITASLSDTVPAGTAYVPGSATGGATYDSAAGAIEWSGTLPARDTVTVTFQVNVEAPSLDGSAILNVAVIEDLTNGTRHRRHATTDVRAPVLTDSVVTVDRQLAYPGDTLTYTVIVRNTGQADGVGVSLYDPIPEGVSYVQDSATGGATYSSSADRVEWGGTVPAGGSKTVTFEVTVDPVRRGLPLPNVATISHPWAYSTSAYARASVLTGAEILVVEDDYTWAENREAYIEALEGNGLARYDIYPMDYLGAPPQDVLETYGTTIWYTGARHGLSNASQASIKAYLATGGDLLLTGGNIAEHTPPSFLTQTLHTSFVMDTPSGDKDLAGIPGDILATVSATVKSYDPDVVEPADGLAVPIIEYTGLATGTAGVRFKGDQSRVVFLSFDLEGVTEQTEREELLGRILGWLRQVVVHLPLVQRGTH